jgi:hypothetical protein
MRYPWRVLLAGLTVLGGLASSDVSADCICPAEQDISFRRAEQCEAICPFNSSVCRTLCGPAISASVNCGIECAVGFRRPLPGLLVTPPKFFPVDPNLGIDPMRFCRVHPTDPFCGCDCPTCLTCSPYTFTSNSTTTNEFGLQYQTINPDLPPPAWFAFSSPPAPTGQGGQLMMLSMDVSLDPPQPNLTGPALAAEIEKRLQGGLIGTGNADLTTHKIDRTTAKLQPIVQQPGDIPTLSGWGMIVMTILLLLGGAIFLYWRRGQEQTA